MERALRVTRPAGLLAARCSPVLSSTRASLRLWQQQQQPCSGPTATPQRTGFIPSFQHCRLSTVRSNHTNAQNSGQENTQAATAAEGQKDGDVQVPEGAQTGDIQAGDRPGGDRSNKTSAKGKATTTKKKKKKQPKKPERFTRMKNDAGVVEFNSQKLKFRWWDTPSNPDLVLSPLWLRDSCPCHLCVDPDSGQKNFSTTELRDRPVIESAQVTTDRTLEIVWANDPPSGGASHKSVFPAEEVKEWLMDDKWQRGRVVTRDPERILWDKAQYEALLAEGRCRVSYKDWLSDEPAFWEALLDLRQTGLIIITDVPSDEAAVERIANRVGPIQETFYGRTWDVRAKPHAENVAYTDKFLGLHQDLLYYDPVPGLQMLHCLSNSCEGGESLFSHGVRAAYELRLKDPAAYKRLAELSVWFGYRKGDDHYFATRQTIKQGAKGIPSEVRWAPPFQATFKLASGPSRGRNLYQWKRAANTFQAILEDDHNVVEFKLKEGECVIFDNRTVLHGRRQFKTGSGGSRWLKGTYVSYQSYLAAATRLAEHLEAGGIQLPLARATWVEQEKVKQSLQERKRADFEQVFSEKKKKSEPVPEPSPIPAAKSTGATETTNSEPTQSKQ
ncbi:uncharacterized protein P884DRAFT_259603 [Thermothelomyces heterothallicus CBS 202.75]|uniref:uncharacterized protein n=1 Tax=Thermothelomyces heterothallicus CBS 202.75 TaxID=1149848 RepID=UPI0037425ABC